MTAPKRERIANNAFSTLNGGIDASQTTLDVVDGSRFPSDGNFRLTVSQEIMLCTARSGDTLTVVRGVEGTTPATHGDGSSVAHLLTAGGLTRWAQDNRGLWGYPGQPALGRITDASGAVIGVSDFAWVNQGGATAVDENGTILLTAPPASGENVRILKRAAPSPPWTVTIAFQMLAFTESIPVCGIYLRKSSDGKGIMAAMNSDSFHSYCLAGYNVNSPTSFNSNILARTKLMSFGRYVWFRMMDNGTNLIFQAGFDGVEWFQVFSVGRTFFMAGGPDEYGFCVNNHGSTLYNMAMLLTHWSES